MLEIATCCRIVESLAADLRKPVVRARRILLDVFRQDEWLLLRLQTQEHRSFIHPCTTDQTHSHHERKEQTPHPSSNDFRPEKALTTTASQTFFRKRNPIQFQPPPNINTPLNHSLPNPKKHPITPTYHSKHHLQNQTTPNLRIHPPPSLCNSSHSSRSSHPSSSS